MGPQTTCDDNSSTFVVFQPIVVGNDMVKEYTLAGKGSTVVALLYLKSRDQTEMLLIRKVAGPIHQGRSKTTSYQCESDQESQKKKYTVGKYLYQDMPG